ncbi:hypothetical protein FB106_1122 [Synechococcus sp. Ace-Pa]|nr:hypothetical protein FB106_1122 [Synechococcus sp. Ace-Pa]
MCVVFHVFNSMLNTGAGLLGFASKLIFFSTGYLTEGFLCLAFKVFGRSFNPFT